MPASLATKAAGTLRLVAANVVSGCIPYARSSALTRIEVKEVLGGCPGYDVVGGLDVIGAQTAHMAQDTHRNARLSTAGSPPRGPARHLHSCRVWGVVSSDAVVRPR